MNLKFVNNKYTKDLLKLPMMHYNANNKDICVIFIHGMCANFLDNYFAFVWGKYLSNHDIGFIYQHNRGHDIANDLVKKDGSFVRCGTAYEIFEDCLNDIDLAIDTARELGYKRIILLGHSYGCNKAIYYCYKRQVNLLGQILASVPDMIGIHKLNEKDYEYLLTEAKKNIDNNEPDKLLSKLIEDYMYMSSKTYYNWYNKNTNLDNVPIINKTDNWYQFESISLPILTFSGELEEYYYKDFDLLKSKAINAKSFTSRIIKNTGHTYNNQEEYIAKLIYEWINLL